MTLLRILLLLSKLLLIATAAFSQGAAVKALDWDLTYSKLTEQNESAQKWKAWAASRNPNRVLTVSRFLDEVGDENVSTAMLLEFHSLGSNGITTLFFVRTKRTAFLWEIRSNQLRSPTRMTINTEKYDKAFKKLKNLEPAIPVSGKENGSNWEGYFGLASYYTKGKTVQKLLTLEDFYLVQETPPKAGRVASALDEVIASIPAPASLLFRPCSLRPTRAFLTEVYGEPVSCYPSDPTNATCYGWEKIQAVFEGDKVQSVVLPKLDRRFEIAHFAPTGSYISLTRYLSKNPRSINVNQLGHGVSESIFEDDCVVIRTRILNTMTGYIPGSHTITWK